MRCHKSRFIAVISGLLLSVAAVTAAYADDTEIFFNQNGADIPANVMFILDTSGSMDSLVKTQKQYDPSVTYKADQCATQFDPNSYYFSSSGNPACGSTDKLPKTQFKCASMLPALQGSAGFATDNFAQWGSTVKLKISGGGSVMVSTTTYAWQRSVDATNTTGYVECKGDAGIDGDGVNLAKLYASTDTFSIQTTTTTPPGTTVVNSDAVSAFPERLTGVWDPTKNIFTKSGTGNATCAKSCTIYSANYLNYLNDSTQTSTRSKMAIMQNAVESLMTSLTGINVGVMRYDYKGNGGMVMAPVVGIDTGTQRKDIINYVSSWAPSGSTPLSETYYEAYLYFSGNPVLYGNKSYSTTCKAWSAVDGTCSGGATSFSAPSVAASRVGGTPGGTKYDSPADYSCRQNFIVYLTDGLPNENSTSDAAIQALNPTKKCDATSVSGATGGKCLATLADYMYQNDMRTDVDKVQNVTSYFIGFGSDFSSGGAPTAAFKYLQAAAAAGGGTAYTATDLTELSSAFNTILSSVIKINTTFTAPAVSVNAFNRTQTLDNLYVSVFAPSATFHWPGNVKKYKFLNGNVVDSLGAPAVSPATGFFTDTARSYWSKVVDGSDVKLGGAAGMLPDAAVRTVYTYTGTTYPTALKAFTAANVTDADLNLGVSASDPARAELVNWALGLDTQDEVLPAGTTDSRHQIGDPVHAQPVTMIYGKKSDGTDDTVVFVPTNDGYFHAIDASVNPDGSDTATSGSELWSYIPKEMLPHLKDLYNDDPVTTKHYGLDGAITALKYDINGDGTISGNDRVILYFGTGRNADTSAYYALDVTNKLKPQLLWKVDGATLAGLGQAWSTPKIARVNISGATQNSQRLVLVIGGGYDAMEDNGTFYPADTVGKHLYMVDAISGNLLWSAGASGADFNNANMTHAIPSPVTVLDIDGDGYADRMYVGDMAAQLWRFDITNGGTAAGLVAGGVMASLGTKKDAVHAPADVRRFYAAPDVAAEQKPKLKPFLSIAIGSGYRGHPLDKTVHDRFYDIRDYNGFRQMSQAEFNALPVIRDAATAAVPALVDITTQATPTLPTDAAGWQLNLNTHPDWSGGEKALVSSRTFNDEVIFTTYSPNTSPPTDPCSGVGTGTNRAYAVSVFDGSPVIDRNNDNILTTDERSQDLRQSGIAPEAAFLFPPSSSNGNMNNPGGGSGSVTCLSGVEVLNVCTKFDQRVKTYWREGMAN